MKPDFYTNAKESVMTYEMFQQIPVKNVMKTIKESAKKK